MKILLSIKPEFVEKIFDGSKKFEFRKAIYRDPNVKSVVIYATKPVGQIVGEFEVTAVLCDSPERIWQRTADYSGITRQFFDQYFEGRTRSFALAVGTVTKFAQPLDPDDIFDNFTPPQSFMYLDEGCVGEPAQMQLAL